VQQRVIIFYVIRKISQPFGFEQPKEWSALRRRRLSEFFEAGWRWDFETSERSAYFKMPGAASVSLGQRGSTHGFWFDVRFQIYSLSGGGDLVSWCSSHEERRMQLD
jgi:hypothetical protein